MERDKADGISDRPGRLCPKCAQHRKTQKEVYGKLPINQCIRPTGIDELDPSKPIPPHIANHTPFYLDENLYLISIDALEFARGRFCLTSGRDYSYHEDCDSEELVQVD